MGDWHTIPPGHVVSKYVTAVEGEVLYVCVCSASVHVEARCIINAPV